jgi:hypothetical protein
MRRFWVIGLVLTLVSAITAWILAQPTTAASSYANPAFQTQWQQGEAITPNLWGPLANAKDGQQEPYKDVPGGSRLVQYFDKGRMELTGGTVTNGLLATELIRGQIQLGDTTFQAKDPPAIPVAGDPDNPGPTYAALAGKAKALLAAAAMQTGNYAQAVIAPSGELSAGTAGSSAATAFTVYDEATQHNVPAAFADYRTKVGLGTIGYAQSEPFTAMVKVGGQQKPVMVQVYERRVLTYTATNPPGFQVEMGNIGQHYYQWRYATGMPTPAPTVVSTTAIPITTVTPINMSTATVAATTSQSNLAATSTASSWGATAQAQSYRATAGAIDRRYVVTKTAIANRDPG